MTARQTLGVAERVHRVDDVKRGIRERVRHAGDHLPVRERRARRPRAEPRRQAAPGARNSPVHRPHRDTPARRHPELGDLQHDHHRLARGEQRAQVPGQRAFVDLERLRVPENRALRDARAT